MNASNTKLRRMEKLANAYKHLRDEPLELFRDDYRSHSGGAPCRPQVRYQVHGQHRRRKYGGEQRHGDDGLLFSSSRSTRFFREHFESELRTRRVSKHSTPIIPPGTAKLSTSTTARVPPLIGGSVPACEHLLLFRECGRRRHSRLLRRVLFPRLRARLLRIIRKSRLAPSMGA